MSRRDLIILGSSSQQPTRYRNHGAYLLLWNGEGLLFDPGEGTQRQFIFANVAPTCVTRIFISHFHGDHCLGLGSMLMRLNLDKVTHPIHCYYPASGKIYFDRLRYSSMYHETIHVVEHPVKQPGIVEDQGQFTIEAYPLQHGVPNLGWRIQEKPERKFHKHLLDLHGIKGSNVTRLLEKGTLRTQESEVTLDQVSYLRPGSTFAYVSDTGYCLEAERIAKEADLFLCESTYLDKHKELAYKHHHLTAAQAAQIAKNAGVRQLVLTHFSARYQEISPFIQEASPIFSQVIAAEDLKSIPFPKVTA